MMNRRTLQVHQQLFLMHLLGKSPFHCRKQEQQFMRTLYILALVKPAFGVQEK